MLFTLHILHTPRVAGKSEHAGAPPSFARYDDFPVAHPQRGPIAAGQLQLFDFGPPGQVGRADQLPDAGGAVGKADAKSRWSIGP